MAALYSRMRSYSRPYLFVRLWFRLLPAVCAGVLLTVALCSAQSTADSPDDPDLALEEARHALLSGQYERVDDLTTAAAGTDPRAGVLRAQAASARGQHDEAIRQLAPHAARDDAAALELGLVFLRVGKDAEGTALLQRILARGNATDVASQFRAARAAHALGLFERANERFREIAGVAGNEPEIQSAWGDLLLEKHNRADAARSFRAALQGNRRYPPAYLGLAKAISDDDPDSARQLVERALTLNPVFVPALVFMAELHLDARDRQGAGDWIGRALAVDPTSLEARSLQAAVAWVEDRRDEFERLAQDLLASNPKYGEVYRVAGAHAARHYRFEEAVELTRRALALNPESSAANAELGMHLLRTGDERDARAALDRAFRADPYDAVTYNLLGLLDTLDTFVTIEDGPIVMRLHPDEAPVLREHALPIARRALTTLSERYGFTPRGPILIEIFPRHDDFAVRTLGLPGMVGALGACFGRVVTLDSPRARPPGTFNWQATLWHELTHVITLQMSNQRVPRWLTEGISIFEERRARPAWGPDLEVSFVDMMTRDEVTPLAELNHAFTRPDAIALAYYHASLVVEFIVSKWGDPGLQRLLKAYGEGLEGDAAFGRALETTAAELDAAFRASMDERFAGLRAALDWPEDSAPVRGTVEDLRTLVDQHPRSYSLLMLFADALQREGRPEEAMAAYERAAALVPTTGEESALAHLAELAESTGDRVRAAAALEQLLARDDANVEAARRRVALLDPDAERDRWLVAHERVAELDPFDADSHTVLGREALGAGDYDNAVRWLRVAVSSRPKDAVAAHCDLADAYLGLRAPGDAKQQALAALEIAPTYPRAQDLLLTIVEGRQ